LKLSPILTDEMPPKVCDCQQTAIPVDKLPASYPSNPLAEFS